MSILDNIQARADKASKGPWAVDHDDFDGASVYMDDGITWGRAYVCTDLQQGEDEGSNDAEFIAHSREDVPALVAALRAVEAMHPLQLGGDPIGNLADICGGCPNYWPCPTIAAITEALEATDRTAFLATAINDPEGQRLAAAAVAIALPRWGS